MGLIQKLKARSKNRKWIPKPDKITIKSRVIMKTKRKNRNNDSCIVFA